MKEARSLGYAVLSRFIGFAVFLLVLVVLNIINNNLIQNNIFNLIVMFLNNSLWLLILITVLLIFGDIFFMLGFPFNIPAPIFSAFGSVFLIRFLFNLFYFINTFIKPPINERWVESFYLLISTIVFFIVLIVGYINVFRSTRRKKRVREE